MIRTLGIYSQFSYIAFQFSSFQLLSHVQLLWPHGLQYARFPRPSSTPRACSNSCPSSWWCHLTISLSIVNYINHVVHCIPAAAAAAAAKSLQSCPTLCSPIDGSPPGSPVPGILQARTLDWVAISFSNAWEWKLKVKSLSHVRLSDPMDYSLPGSSIHWIFQARVLDWGAIG